MNTDDLKNETPADAKPVLVAGASQKPKKEDYGWHDGGLYEDTGWMFEGGEEAYFEALKKWEDANSTCH